MSQSGDKNANNERMSTTPINNLSSYIQAVLSTALQSAGLVTKMTGNTLSGIDAFSAALRPDNSQLSPFARLMSTLQQLQQSDPTKYQQVTQQIAADLQKAAETAQADGNTTAANQLNQLATDFANASTSGELPDILDLALAIGGHRHHHRLDSASADSDSESGASSSSISASSTTSQLLDQLLAALQTSGTQDGSLDPMAIILNALANSGITMSDA